MNNPIDASHPDTPFLTPYYKTLSGKEAMWSWGLRDRIPPDTALYHLYVLGKKDKPLEVSVNTWNEGFLETNWVYLLPGDDGIAYFGEVIVGDSDTERSEDDTYLTIRVRNPGGGMCYFDGIVLSPLPQIYGRINLNTADTEVLHSLPGDIFALSSSFVEDRIYNDSPYLTPGMILESLAKWYGSASNPDWDDERVWEDFARISNLICVRGKLFKIEVIGRAVRDVNGNQSYDEGVDEVLGEYYITTLYQR